MPRALVDATQIGERVAAIDALRGVALLGILTMNITLGQPGAAQFNPLTAGGFTGANLWAWLIGFFVFDDKMITIFAMLFGAGLVLFAERLQRRGIPPARVFYRRSAILLLLGLLHAYGLWQGDILVTYAVCGALIYPLRNKSPRVLLILGTLMWLVSVPLAVKFSKVLNEARQNHSALWTEIASGLQPDPAHVAAEIKSIRAASYLRLAADRAPEAFNIETQLLLISLLWTVSGRMLLGMALLKAGFFTGSARSQTYLWTAMLGYGAGLPLVATACRGLIRNGFDPVYLFGTGFPLNGAGSIFVGIGHISVFMLLYQSGRARALMQRLQSVGRMALTNYLMQTLIATTLFYGYGFALFGAFSRVQLYGIVLVIWVLQLWYSPLWLYRFRFGPVEWFWRSLTYGRAQKMAIEA